MESTLTLRNTNTNRQTLSKILWAGQALQQEHHQGELLNPQQHGGHPFKLQQVCDWACLQTSRKRLQLSETSRLRTSAEMQVLQHILQVMLRHMNSGCTGVLRPRLLPHHKASFAHSSYNRKAKLCQLCMMEETFISRADPRKNLNKRNESKFRQVTSKALGNFFM